MIDRFRGRTAATENAMRVSGKNGIAKLRHQLSILLELERARHPFDILPKRTRTSTFAGGFALDFVSVFLLVLIVLAVASLPLAFLWVFSSRRAKRFQRTLEETRSRFAAVLNVEDEVARIRADAEREHRAAEQALAQREAAIESAEADVAQRLAAEEAAVRDVREQYRQKREIYDRLVSEIAIFDERLAFAEMGVYEPHFDFDDSETFKAAIVRVRDRQKLMVDLKTAVFCDKTWTVDGSKSKGQTMTNRGIRLTLRAFNNECDAAIANTRWNNVNAMEKRIARAREQVDKLNASNAIEISTDYLKLKLEELFLTHEYREKLKIEREERAEMARLAREEQRLQRDMEQAQEDEDHYARLLAKAKKEADSVVGPKLDAFADQIRTLEKDLAEAHSRVERAQALAERTRSGYVYIISNIGSFGEGVVKIGLTRRLDPLDRVRELGDASVPFVFDTHAIIYSDDAPALERALHGEFEATRINAQNYRKEFFRASIDDVENAVRRLAPAAPFFRDVEAQEYRETLSRRQAALTITEPERELFPAEI